MVADPPAAPGDTSPPCRDPRLADLCHRVRTPLHGVLGSLELLLDRELPDEASELARSAFAAAAELHRAFEGYVDEVVARERAEAAGQELVADADRAVASPSMR